MFSALEGRDPNALIGLPLILPALGDALPADDLCERIDGLLLTGSPSLREVIAFPKTQRGTCLTTGAPGKVEATQLKELHVRLATDAG